MKIKYLGPIDVDDYFQAFYQDKITIFAEHGIKHILSATHYFRPCDDLGQPLTITGSDGRPIEGCISAGAYFSAADQHDKACRIEPKVLTRPRVLRP